MTIWMYTSLWVAQILSDIFVCPKLSRLLSFDTESNLYVDVFKADPDYAENEAKYKALRREILDEASEDENSGDEADEESDDIPSEEDDSHQAEKYESMFISASTIFNL